MVHYCPDLDDCGGAPVEEGETSGELHEYFSQWT
jgi:hypothetical protein